MTLHSISLRCAWCRVALLVVIIVINAPSVLAQDGPVPGATPPAPPSAPPPQGSPTPQSSPTPSLERRFFKNILHDQQAIWTSAFRVRGRDARWLAPLGIATSALLVTDNSTAGALGDDDKNRLAVSRGISEAGALYTTGGIAATLYLVGRKTGDLRLRETGVLGAEAIINGQIVSTALKSITQRPRPRESNNRVKFFDKGKSFPSGHAVSAWSLATVIAHEYKNRPLIKFGAYSVAVAVSLSRFTGRNHFLSDVLVGSAIGYGIGEYVYRTHHDPALESTSQVIPRPPSKLLPLIIPRYERAARNYGVALVWSF